MVAGEAALGWEEVVSVEALESGALVVGTVELELGTAVLPVDDGTELLIELTRLDGELLEDELLRMGEVDNELAVEVVGEVVSGDVTGEVLCCSAVLEEIVLDELLTGEVLAETLVVGKLAVGKILVVGEVLGELLMQTDNTGMGTFEQEAAITLL